GLVLVLLLVPGGLASLVLRVWNTVVRRAVGDDLADRGGFDAPADAVGRQPLPPSVRPVDADVDAAAGDGAVLAAEGVVVRFGGNTALNAVSLVLRAGEIVGLVGPNGAGKTTLFDVLSGHCRADAGRVVLGGVDVTA